MRHVTCSRRPAARNWQRATGDGRASARGACARVRACACVRVRACACVARARIDKRTSQEVVASAVAVVDQVLSSDATRAKLLAEEADLMAQIAAAEAEELWSAAEWEVRQNTNSD